MITWMSWRYGILQCWVLQLCIFYSQKSHLRTSKRLRVAHRAVEKATLAGPRSQSFLNQRSSKLFCWSLPMICNIFVTWHEQKLLNISEYLAIHNNTWILFALFSTTQVFILTYWCLFWSFVKWQQPVLITFQSIKKCSQMAGEISFIIIPCPILCFFCFYSRIEIGFWGVFIRPTARICCRLCLCWWKAPKIHRWRYCWEVQAVLWSEFVSLGSLLNSLMMLHLMDSVWNQV